MKKITRRTVLRASGLAAASLALSGCAPTGSACVGNGFSDWLQQTLGKGGSAASSESTEAAAPDAGAASEAPAESADMHPPVNFDVSLPQVDIGRFADACRAAFDARWPGHHSLFFGHVGDGNLHVTVDSKTINGEDEQLEAALYALVQQFHGSVSAEHGIGLHKKPYLPFSRTAQELAVMRAIKSALDPLGLMNPGKVF